jgi:hypothetical protein
MFHSSKKPLPSMLIILHDAVVQYPYQGPVQRKHESTLHDYERSVDLNAIKSTACQAVNLNAGGSRKLPIKHTWYHSKAHCSFQGRRRGE